MLHYLGILAREFRANWWAIAGLLIGFPAWHLRARLVRREMPLYVVVAAMLAIIAYCAGAVWATVIVMIWEGRTVYWVSIHNLRDVPLPLSFPNMSAEGIGWCSLVAGTFAPPLTTLTILNICTWWKDLKKHPSDYRNARLRDELEAIERLESQEVPEP